jgi:hypothetical protein
VLRGLSLPDGGLRWWFACPRTGRNVGKLYMPIGGRQFASREAWRLAYPSQRETTAARITRRAVKLRRKLDPEADCALGDIPEKPKWMRWPTYNRIADQIDKAEQHANEDLMRAAQRFMRYA